MRILILGINFFPELTGIGKYTGEMAASLVQRGHKVRVVTAPPYYPYWQVQSGYHGWKYSKESWQGVEVYRCPIWVPKRLTGIKRLLHLFSFALSSAPVALMQVSWHPDIVICIAPSLMNAPVASLIARLCGARSWLHIQDFELDAAGNLGILPKNQFMEKFAVYVEHWIFSRFNRISTISNRMIQRLIQKGVDQEKTCLFPNWVDTSLIFPIHNSNNQLRQNLNLEPDQVVVLYSGNMGKKQGLDVMIEAARLLQDDPKIFFVLCGDGNSRTELQDASKDLINLKFLPLQPIEKLNELLNLADIHVLPQRADAADLVMPSKLSGMLASGKAIIVTANPRTEVAEVVDKFGVIVSPENSVSFAEAIIWLAKNPEERARMGNEGLAWVRKNWSKNKILGDFCSIIEKEINRNKGYRLEQRDS